jgi:hypothetical protein
MITFTIYAIGCVGDLNIEAVYEDHRKAELACQPPICADGFTRALRANGLAFGFDRLHIGMSSPFKNRSPSSAKAMLDDLTARLLYLAENPNGQSSLIYVEHQGFRLSDPVDEMLFKVSRTVRPT